MDNLQEKKPVPPYLSYKTFRGFIDSFGVTELNRVDRSAMPSLSGQNQSWLIGALKYFKLIKEDGTPEEMLAQLSKATDQEKKKFLREMLRHSYPFVFDSIKLEAATPKQLEEQFNKTGATGDTIRKCIAFFLAAAKDADIPLSPLLRTMRYSRNVSQRGRRQSGSVTSSLPAGEELGGSSEHEDSWAAILMSKFPTFDPAWPDDVKAKWFDAFKQMMEMMKGQEEGQE